MFLLETIWIVVFFLFENWDVVVVVVLVVVLVVVVVVVVVGVVVVGVVVVVVLVLVLVLVLVGFPVLQHGRCFLEIGDLRGGKSVRNIFVHVGQGSR